MGNCIKSNKINTNLNNSCEVIIKKVRWETNGILELEKKENNRVIEEYIYNENCNFMIDNENFLIYNVKNVIENKFNKSFYKFSLNKVKNNFYIKLNCLNNNSDNYKFWVHLHNFSKVKFYKNQSIKMGKIKLFYVGVSNELVTISKDNGSKSNYSSKSKNKSICRICLDSEKDGNLFLEFCSCSKNMPMHHGCIKKWWNTIIQKRETRYCVYYKVDNLFCELCNDRFPPYIIKNEQIYSLFDFPETRNFAIFTIINYNLNEIKEILLLFLDSNFQYNIGRLQKNEIIIVDNSVSRDHALLSYNKSNNSFFISDNNSKFGTFKELNKYDIDKGIVINNFLKLIFNKFSFDFKILKNIINSSSNINNDKKLINYFSQENKLYEIDIIENLNTYTKELTSESDAPSKNSKNLNEYKDYLEIINKKDQEKLLHNLNKSSSFNLNKENLDESWIYSNFDKLLKEAKNKDSSPVSLKKVGNSSIFNNEIFDTNINLSSKKHENIYNYQTKKEIIEIKEESEKDNNKPYKNKYWGYLKKIIRSKKYKVLLKKKSVNKNWNLVKFLFKNKKLLNQKSKNIFKIKSLYNNSFKLKIKKNNSF